MSWSSLRLAACGTHHIDERDAPVYGERFDEVLKFHTPGLAPVRRGALAWHIRVDGAPAYERRFSRTFGFYEGLAAVASFDVWHHITSDGADAYSDRFAWCGNFQEGRCAVRDTSGAYLHIQTNGHAVYRERWRYAGDYRDGVAVVQASDGRSTHIDREGRQLHGHWFIDLDVFHKGFARARDEGGWTHVDTAGRAAYSRRFASVEPFYNGQARVERFDGGLEIIDEAGVTLVELRAARRSEFAALSADMVGFWRTQTIAAAVQLGVPEALPSTEAALAERCTLHRDGTRRLLRALAELRLVTRDGDQWKLTSRGAFLRADHPLTLADAALEYAGPLSKMWDALPDALRHGSTWKSPDVFGEVARDEGRRQGHHRMLQSYARHDYADLCQALDLRGDERVIDAAGGLGVLGQIVMDAHPSLHLTVLERPEVVAQAAARAPALHWHPADIFERWGLKADVVLLSRVLHDWDDAAALRILRHARAALPIGGRICVIEMLLPENSGEGGLCDLHLLMATGGRERSTEEFGQLFDAAGFHLQGVRTVAALPSIVIGVAS
jgi:hypothetical protein